MLEELCLQYPQHEAAKVVGKQRSATQRSIFLLLLLSP